MTLKMLEQIIAYLLLNKFKQFYLNNLYWIFSIAMLKDLLYTWFYSEFCKNITIYYFQ
jgi:hypothetical protein